MQIQKSLFGFGLAILFVSGIYCRNSKTTQEEKINPEEYAYKDTITKRTFFQLADQVNKDMDSSKRMSINETLTMVRLYNSLGEVLVKEKDSTSELLMRFGKTFEDKYISQAATTLEFGYGKGMTYYSPKYDLYIGGTTPNKIFTVK